MKISSLGEMVEKLSNMYRPKEVCPCPLFHWQWGSELYQLFHRFASLLSGSTRALDVTRGSEVPTTGETYNIGASTQADSS